MITPQPFTAKLEEKTVHNQRFIQFAFELVEPHSLPFQAGQYVSLQITPEGDRRSYSICSKPSLDHGFELLVDISPGGLGSQYLAQLQFGDTVSGLAPLGSFTLNPASTEQALVFIATGSGIGPLHSMIHHLIQDQEERRPISLYWGMRHPHDFFWLHDYQDLVVAASNFAFYPVISQVVPEWTLSTGRVTHLLAIHQFQPETGYYICGSNQMIGDVKQLLLDKGVTSEYIHHEKYF